MRLFILYLFLFYSLCVSGQTGGRGDHLFDKGDYYGALKLYGKELERTTEKKQKDKIKARMANCMFRLNDVAKAGQIYNSLPEEVFSVDDYLFYAVTCQRAGEYDKALDLAQMVEDLGGDSGAIELLRASCQFAKGSVKEKPLFSATKTGLDFNGFPSGEVYYKGNGLIVAAPSGDQDAAVDSRGYRFTRLYNVIFSGERGRMIPFAEGLVDKYHIGAVTFTKDFKRIYYTRTILKKDGSSILKLMTAVESGGKWKDIQELNINSEDYSCAHPALYKDSILFFVSDMPGGMGGKDIYITTVEGAMCGEIQNIGEVINTPGDELFPWVDEEGRLYFASNGHVGFGGLDVFVSSFDGNKWKEPVNMGRPINSSMDDFGLVFKDSQCKEGYVSSNRGGTGAKDFLFAIKLLPVPGTSKAPARHSLKIPMIAGMDRREEERRIEEQRKAEAPALMSEQELFDVDYKYTIQVGAFRNPVPRVYFEAFKNVKVYLGFDNIYRYTVGEYPEKDIAGMELVQVAQVVPDAFVVDVEQYVKQKKIQHHIKGDDISDDELLLRRLKYFEEAKKARQQVKKRYYSPRYLSKPKEEEVVTTDIFDGYMITLKKTGEVLTKEDFQGVRDVEVFKDRNNRYVYSVGFYLTADAAIEDLGRLRKLGYPQAAIEATANYKYWNNINTIQYSPRKSISASPSQDLKDLLSL